MSLVSAKKIFLSIFSRSDAAVKYEITAKVRNKNKACAGKERWKELLYIESEKKYFFYGDIKRILRC